MQNSMRIEISEGALVTLEHFTDIEEEHPTNRPPSEEGPFRCSQGPEGWKVQGCRSWVQHREGPSHGEQCLTVQ